MPKGKGQKGAGKPAKAGETPKDPQPPPAAGNQGKISTNPKQGVPHASKQQRKRAAKHRALIALNQSVQPESVASQFRDAGGATQGGDTAIRFSVTRLCDYKNADADGAPVLKVCYNLLNNTFIGQHVEGLVDNPTPMQRVNKCNVWVLPMTSIGSTVSDRTYVCLFGVPASDPTQKSHRLIEQRTTIIKPDYNINWVKVGSIDYTTAFDDSVLKPQIVYIPDEEPRYPCMTLFELSIVDPVTAYAKDSSFQVMYEFEMEQFTPLANSIVKYEGKHGGWCSVPSGTLIDDGLVLLEPTSLVHDH